MTKEQLISKVKNGTARILERNGFDDVPSVEDLFRHSYEDMLKLRGIGKGTLADIERAANQRFPRKKCPHCNGRGTLW